MAGQPLVIAHHLMWTLYGWWLPNDPRGSTSQVIRNDVLNDLGELHFGRKRIQPAGRDIRTFYRQADAKLMHPLLSFSPSEFPAIGEILGTVVKECRYTCWAMAVMPDHIHILIRKHRDDGEEMIEKLQSLSRTRFTEAGIRTPEHRVWTHGGWDVFLDHPDEIQRTIHYIEQNPVKRGWPIQRWEWVQEYDGWPLHPGHSASSPYAKALKAVGRYP